MVKAEGPEVHPTSFIPYKSEVLKTSLAPNLSLQHSKWAEQPCYLKYDSETLIIGNGFLEAEFSVVPAPSFEMVRLKNKVSGKEWLAPEDKRSPFILSAAKGDELSYAKVPEVNMTVESNHFPDIVIELGEQTESHCSFTAKLTGQADIDMSFEFKLRQTDHFFSYRVGLKNMGKSRIALLSIDGLAAGKKGWSSRWRMPSKAKGAPEQYIRNDVGFLAKPGESFKTGWFDSFIKIKNAWRREYFARLAPPAEGKPFVHFQGWYDDQIRFHGRTPTRLETADKIMSVFKKLGGKSAHTATWTYNAYGWTKDSDAYKNLLAFSKLSQKKYGIPMSIGVHWDQEMGKKCLLSQDVQKAMAHHYAAFKERGSNMFGVDFFGMRACEKTDHNHFPGKYSLYPQTKNFIDWLASFQREGALRWTWLGFNRDFSPFVDGMHVSDGVGGVGADIHFSRLRATESSRLGKPGGGIPATELYGHMGHAGFDPKVRIHDSVGWRYALLSRLAIGPNISFQFVSADMPEQEISFTRSWIDWAARNSDTLYEVSVMQFKSKTPVRGYSHLVRDRGFFSLVNPTYISHKVELDLNSLEEAQGGLYATELYPSFKKVADGNAISTKTPWLIEIPPMSAMTFRVGPKEYVEKAEPGQSTPPMPKENFISEWSEEKKDGQTVFSSTYKLLPELKEFLSKRDTTTSEEKWRACPHGYAKVYLIPCLSLPKVRGKKLSQNGWDKIKITLQINAQDVPVHLPPVAKGRNGTITCHLADIGDVLKGGENKIQISFKSPKDGVVFHGVWLDWPQF